MDVMRNLTLVLVLLLAPSVMLGCRATSVAQRSPVTVHDEVVRSAPTGHQQGADAEPAENAELETRSIQQVSAEIGEQVIDTDFKPIASRYSVRAAIEIALMQNPDLVAFRQIEGVGNAAVRVAQTYPFNPFVQVQATPLQYAPRQDTTNAGSGTIYHYVLLMQQIQLGGQQHFREEAASAAFNGIRWNVLQAELLNVAQTERFYFTALYQQGLRDISETNANNSKLLLDILENQLQGGVATSADVAMVRLDARSTRQQQRIAEANYKTALLDLKRHLGLAADAKVELDASIMKWKWQPATVVQVTSMASNRPDVMAARSDASAARANAEVANGNRTPDVQIGPYYQRTDTGITFFGFRGQMDLPVINDGVPMLRQREAEYCQRVTTAQQLSLRAQIEAEAATDRYERARQIRIDFGEDDQTANFAALQELEEQFKAKEVDIARVIQARQSLLQSQRADLDTLNELMQSAAAVTAASGMPLEMLVEQTNTAD
jgi:outer membrane protein, heavy metal efflux system